MSLTLRPHPDTPCGAAIEIVADMTRPRGGALDLRYAMTGDIAAVRLPGPARHERTDGLWRHTCFEAFLRPGDGEAYCEFNFAPSSAWAAYRFTGYREGMAALEIGSLDLEVRGGSERLDLHAGLDGLVGAAWRLGVCAVIEEADGRLSYWAATHPPGKPDFHHPAGFAYQLP